VRFLVDRCAGRRLAEFLRASVHDVAESRSLGPDRGDATLRQWAAVDGRVVVTIQSDFRRLVSSETQPHCGVVRLPDVPAAARIRLLAELVKRHGEDLEKGAIITVRGHRIRVSRRS
jgi:predicted nuclease of predicted toxin-antitoxin system